MYNRRGKAGFKRDWLGRKTDKRPPLKDEYIFIYHDIQGEKTKDYYRNEEREWFFEQIGYNINNRRISFRKFLDLTFL